MRNEAVLVLATETGVLCLLKSFDGSEVRPLDGGLVTIDVVEAIVGIGEGRGDSAIVIETGSRTDSVPALVCADVQIESRGFDTTGAEQAPVVAGDEFDQHQFCSIRGLVAVDGCLSKVLVGSFVFVGENSDFGGHAML
jgi:hypothetical protein